MSASRTAEYVALYRALETTERRREPLFRDPLAARFLTGSRAVALRLANLPGCRSLLERYADSRAPGARTSAIGRTRFIDDVVRAEVGRGARQLVILGAGYDARSHRMPELADVTVFEVDRPQTQVAKRAGLAGARGLAAQVHYVPVDFSTQRAGDELATAGYAPGRTSLFVWEGVSNYLDADAVAGVLGMVARSAPGSAIVFTYIHRGVLDGSVRFPGADQIVASVHRLGEPWRFGFVPSELPAALARHGLALEQDLGADEYRGRYFDTALAGYAFYRVAVARVR